MQPEKPSSWPAWRTWLDDSAPFIGKPIALRTAVSRELKEYGEHIELESIDAAIVEFEKALNLLKKAKRKIEREERKSNSSGTLE